MEKKNLINTSISAGAGLGTYYAAKELANYPINKIIKATKINLTDEQIARMDKAVRELACKEDFKAKGIKVADASTDKYLTKATEGYNKHLEELRNRIDSTKNPFKKLQLMWKRNRYRKFGVMKMESYHKAENACYMANEKTILVNMKKGINMFFHEAGHAMDFLNPALQEFFLLGKNKNLTKRFPLLTLGTALLMPPVKKDTTIPDEKVIAFFKKYCGAIATLGFIPLVASETSANLNAQKFVKRYADKIDLKTLTKTHIRSAASYWGSVIILGLIVHLANKTGDKVREHLNKKN
ncbi:MAG: hypothetical protein NC191_04580 [Muribaculaceae bacterium]|nr:hypothetical protein [Muribaculaceae bacterium]